VKKKTVRQQISHLKEFGSGRVGGVGVSTKEKVRNIQVKAF
jgi:hypothetical protein